MKKRRLFLIILTAVAVIFVLLGLRISAGQSKREYVLEAPLCGGGYLPPSEIGPLCEATGPEKYGWYTYQTFGSKDLLYVSLVTLGAVVILDTMVLLKLREK